MLTAQQIALWADRLRDISAMGLLYTDSQYDRERYVAIQDVCLEMLAAATHEPVAALEPLRAPVFSRPTPFSVGDAAIINDAGEILLIQRADNQRWAMPGGILEVGETPAQGVAREALEEAGIVCEPHALVGVYDSRLWGGASRHHLYQFVFLCRLVEVRSPAQASHAYEVLDVRWFAEDALPATLDPNHVLRIPEAFRVWHGDPRTYFDAPNLAR